MFIYTYIHIHTCHILPPSAIDVGLCLAVFAGSGGKYLFHRIGWKGRIWQLCVYICVYSVHICIYIYIYTYLYMCFLWARHPLTNPRTSIPDAHRAGQTMFACSTCVCVYIYIYIHTYIYIYIYTHIYIYIERERDR